MTIDIDDVNKLAHQLRTRDPQAAVTRHHMNRLHGVQTVTKQLERNHERYERELMKAEIKANYSMAVVNFGNTVTGRFPKRRTIYG